MKTFDIQSVAIEVPCDRVFAFVASPANLPKWTNAFARADRRSALMRTPQGELSVGLKTEAQQDAGTVDWTMTLPDGSFGRAFSRVTPDGPHTSIYCFVLMAPPVPLEQLEGAFEVQKETLSNELKRLKSILENHAEA